MDDWFCERGDFWGTTSQLTLCAKCGQDERKKATEPRHFGHKPALHHVCDECFESLPA